MTITSCDRSAYTFFGLLPNTEYEIAIRAENSVGAGPSSPTNRVRSGQARALPPENVTVVRVDSSYVELEWSAIQVLFPKTVDGYVVGILSLQNCGKFLKVSSTSETFSTFFILRNRPNTLCCF